MTERFVSPCAKPGPYENEVLTILAEECAEVIQRVTKAQRFGLEERQPGQQMDNAGRLALEIGDVLAMVDTAIEAGLVRRADIDRGYGFKMEKLRKFLQARPPGEVPK